MKYILLFTFFLYSLGGFAQLDAIDKLTTTKEIEEKEAAVQLPFEFSKANIQKFNGGAPGSGSTTMLTVFLKKLTNENLEFNKIWLNNAKPYYQLKLKRKFQTDNWNNYNADDELILFASGRNNNPKPFVDKAAATSLPPHEFTGVALVEYSFKGEILYYEIPVLEKLQDINAQ